MRVLSAQTRGRGSAGIRTFPLEFLPLLVFLLVPNGAALGQVTGGGFPHGSIPEGVGCVDCHTTEGWRPLREDPSFQHPLVAGLPLEGKHSDLACVSCHEDLRFDGPEPGEDRKSVV